MSSNGDGQEQTISTNWLRKRLASIRRAARIFLGIEETSVRPPVPTEKYITQEIEKITKQLFDSYIGAYWAVSCCECHKTILAHYGGTYRNNYGEVFCSHACIDANKLRLSSPTHTEKQ